MSITNETLQQHLKEPAIFCCRRQKGLVISAADLEDPTLFGDMEEAGLLKLSPDGLRIEQVLGATLLEDVEALTPITKEVLDKVNEVNNASADDAGKTSQNVFAEQNADEKRNVRAEQTKLPSAPSAQINMSGNGKLHIEIGKAQNLENFKLDIPVFPGTSLPAAAASIEPEKEKKVIRQLIKKHIKITDVEIGEETSIKDGKITIDKDIVRKAALEDSLCKSIGLSVIRPDARHVYTETIMDVCPIATKVEGELGSGVTKVADGVVFMLTGVDEDGVQIHEFGSSEGYLDEKMPTVWPTA